MAGPQSTNHLADVAPLLPAGRFVELPTRGTTFVRESGGRAAPTVMLLHGLGATASLNWYTSFPALASEFHVVALDHRGHGRGIRDSKPFTLEDAADDAVCLADALDIERFIVVGYSMGGAIAQLIWRHHRERLHGIVLCATSDGFRATAQEHAMFAWLRALEHACAFVPHALGAGILSVIAAPYLAGCAHAGWVRDELLSGDRRAVLQAASALARYSSSEWISDIDVPSAVLVHCSDQLVPPARQLALTSRLRDTVTHVVDGDHYAPLRAPERFTPALVAGVNDVARRVRARSAVRRGELIRRATEGELMTRQLNAFGTTKGRCVTIELRDGTRLENCDLVSSGGNRARTMWLFANGEDVFVPIDDVVDLWESWPRAQRVPRRN